MSCKRTRKPLPRDTAAPLRPIRPPGEPARPLGCSDETRQRILHGFVLAALLGLGSYIAILNYGKQIVPNSDFPAFVQTGEEILHFQKPTSFKRLPGLGVMQVALGFLAGGDHPNLTAGWVLNSVFFVLSAMLLYLVAHHLLGSAAVWFAIPALLNPWTLAWMRQPIAEMPLVFFTLATFYLAFGRSRWRYPFAVFASMIRYEGAALILVVLLLDQLAATTRRQRVRALILSAVCLVPMTVWLIATQRNYQPGTSSYITGYSPARRMVFGEFTDYLWQVSVSSYFVNAYEVLQDNGTLKLITERFREPSWILFGVCLAVAVGVALYQKKGKALALVLFVGAYYLAHATRNGTRPRYAIPVAWCTFLLACYGLRLLAGFGRDRRQIPRQVKIGFFVALAAACLFGITRLLALMPRIGIYRYYTLSYYIPHVAVAVTCLILAARLLAQRGRFWPRETALALLVCLMVVGNQFILAPLVGSGLKDAEFKTLAAWYKKNARPGELLVTTMPHILSLYAPKYEADFYHTKNIDAQSPYEFLQRSYHKAVTYVTWDGRLGYATTNSYYNTWGMRNIAILQTPKDHGPYLFVSPQITNPYYPNRIINVFRLDYTGFDELVDWFRGHAQPDQKMVTALSSALVRLFAPELKGRIVHTSRIRADSFEDFQRQCRQQHIEYIVWDSLMSNQADKGSLYREWGLEHLEPLRQAIRYVDLTDRKIPIRAGECELVHHILHENKILIAVFRLPPEPSPPSPQGNAP